MFTQFEENAKKTVVQFGQLDHSGKISRIPVLVTSQDDSVTKGWSIQYTAMLGNSGLFDGNGVQSLYIPNFSQFSRYIIAAYVRFQQGVNRQKLSNMERSIFEVEDLKTRFTVTSRKNSAYVTATILDTESPFYMLTVPFTVMDDRNNQGSYYIVGYSRFYNKETDTFENIDAYLSPKKRRAVPVSYNSSTRSQEVPVSVRFNNAGQVVGNQHKVAITGGKFEYLQKVNSKYKAMAIVVESTLQEYAFSFYEAHQQSVAEELSESVPSFTNQPVLPADRVQAAASVQTEVPTETVQIQEDDVEKAFS